MLTKKEFKIIELFVNNVFMEPTIRDIMKKLKTSSYSWTYNAVKLLEKENVLNITKKGNSSLCKINLEEQKTITYLSVVEQLRASKKNIPNIKKIMKEIEISYFTLLVTGSYAGGKKRKDSDLDIVVIVGENRRVKPILNKLRNAGEIIIPEVHPYVFTEDEFIKMLTEDGENYGKEIAKKHLIIAGAEPYYRILRKAIKNGYKN